jgi:hypothetical protein
MLPMPSEATKRWMRAQFEQHTRYVERVLQDIQTRLFPDFEVHAEFSDLTREYVWGIGYRKEVAGHRHVRFVIEVCPLWSSSGELTGLRSALMLPKRQDLLALAAELGLTFDGFGVTMDTGIEHAADEFSLMSALERLLPPRFVAAVIPVLQEAAIQNPHLTEFEFGRETVSLVAAL